MTLPPGAIGPTITATFCALWRVHATQGRATIREVMEATGRRSLREPLEHLHVLAEHGLVDVGVPGGLRPLVTAHVPIPNPGATA